MGLENAENQKVILTYIGDGVAKLVVNNPPMNLVTPELVDELRARLDEAEQDERIRALVVTGAGERAFSTGSDIKVFPLVMDDPVGKKLREESRVFNKLAALPKPTVAAIEGYACGGGVELALACDIRVASEAAKFSLPEAKVGVFPSSGGVYRLPRLIGNSLALELMYLGEFIDAEEAKRIGLVNRLAPAGEAVNAAVELARKIADRPVEAIRAIKTCVLASHTLTIEQNEELALSLCRDVYSSPDCLEGIRAFIEKRPPRFSYKRGDNPEDGQGTSHEQ